MNNEWGKTGYDDLLKRYRVGKSHLYNIIYEDPKIMSKELRKSLNVIMDFRKRHDDILKLRRNGTPNR
jgi:hypothetical protein